MEAGTSTPLHSPGARALGVGAVDSEAVAMPGEEEGLEGGGHPRLSVCQLLAEPQGSVFELRGRLSSSGLRRSLLAVSHWVSANILFVERTRLLNTKGNKNVKNRYPPLSRIREGSGQGWATVRGRRSTPQECLCPHTTATFLRGEQGPLGIWGSRSLCGARGRAGSVWRGMGSYRVRWWKQNKQG